MMRGRAARGLAAFCCTTVQATAVWTWGGRGVFLLACLQRKVLRAHRCTCTELRVQLKRGAHERCFCSGGRGFPTVPDPPPFTGCAWGILDVWTPSKFNLSFSNSQHPAGQKECTVWTMRLWRSENHLQYLQMEKPDQFAEVVWTLACWICSTQFLLDAVIWDVARVNIFWLVIKANYI